jgi:hypothetical protein
MAIGKQAKPKVAVLITGVVRYINSGQNPINLTHLPARWRPCRQSPSRDSDIEAATACQSAPSSDNHWVSPVNRETAPALKVTVRIPWGTAMPPSLAEKSSHSERDLGEGLSKLTG